jgi:hypothetical protein
MLHTEEQSIWTRRRRRSWDAFFNDCPCKKDCEERSVLLGTAHCGLNYLSGTEQYGLIIGWEMALPLG